MSGKLREPQCTRARTNPSIITSSRNARCLALRVVAEGSITIGHTRSRDAPPSFSSIAIRFCTNRGKRADRHLRRRVPCNPPAFNDARPAKAIAHEVQRYKTPPSPGIARIVHRGQGLAMPHRGDAGPLSGEAMAPKHRPTGGNGHLGLGRETSLHPRAEGCRSPP